ncbi:hypothetical protein CesoFtcFv8_009403 [Champsocephalus esox]|uniref:Uncharacterized protein n=1 Tax=Champsocephalus esox TaxID=159716 RepID=A0AAN8CCL3_9TELE|nr:hypothetical protein CesoFtcFv8_009403 [Champsocephalus esox]
MVHTLDSVLTPGCPPETPSWFSALSPGSPPESPFLDCTLPPGPSARDPFLVLRCVPGLSAQDPSSGPPPPTLLGVLDFGVLFLGTSGIRPLRGGFCHNSQVMSRL